jgi:hypothetical protein
VNRPARLALLYLAASGASARWHRSWGATTLEARDGVPGDGLACEPAVQTTRALTINAGPGDVWRWLVQIGQGRGGFYTYEWIQNAIGAHMHNADRILPEHQSLAPGDRIRLTPEFYLGRVPGQFYRVAEILPGRALVLVQQPPAGGSITWSFVLRRVPPNRTRLIVRSRRSAPPSTFGRIMQRLELLLLEPGYFVMERGMLRGIKRRAESSGVRSRSVRAAQPAAVREAEVLL